MIARRTARTGTILLMAAAAILAMLAAVTALLSITGYEFKRIDWLAYSGPAELPSQPDVIDSSLVTLHSVRLGEFDALNEPPSLTWSQFVNAEIKAECVPDVFQQREPGRQWGQPRKHPHRLRASLGLQFVRRNPFGFGEYIAHTVYSGARVDENNRMSWWEPTWIPHVPGHYRVRVIMITSRRDASNVRHHSEPIVIGTFDLEVLPGTPAAN